MEVIVLQHINIEDPGYIKDLMIADRVQLTTIELDKFEKDSKQHMPSLNKYSEVLFENFKKLMK